MPKGRRGKELSLAVSAYRKIKEEILRNRFPSGEFISINDLIHVLNGMGRTPVREAVQRLHDERLLTVVPRKGIIIPEFDIKKMMDQLEVRYVLERFAYVKAVKNIDDDLLEELGDVLKSFDTTKGKSSFMLAKLNMSFHMKIVKAVRNRELVDILSRIYDHHIRIYTYFLTDKDRFTATQQEHRKILDALRDGNEDVVKAAVDNHFENTKNLLLSSILK